jgi:hypothetical protein
VLAEELIQVIREDYLDDVTDPCAGDDEDAPYAFSNTTLLRHLSEAQRQATRRRDLRHLRDDTTPEICDITLVGGQVSYPLDRRVLRIASARIGTGGPLVHTTVAALDAMRRGWRSLGPGLPIAFVIHGRQLVLERPPAEALDGETLHLEVWREPLGPLVLGAEPELPGEHRALVHWACHMAYSRRDEEIYNPAAAAEHLAQFERVYGPVMAERVIAELLRVPDGLALTPVPAYGAPVRSGRAIEGW